MSKVGFNRNITVIEGPHGTNCGGSIIRELRFIRAGCYEELAKKCNKCNKDFKGGVEYEE